jgi:hypothetical protein
MSDVRWTPVNQSFQRVQSLHWLSMERNTHRHSSNLTCSVDRGLNANLLEAHLQTVISEAQTLADFEKIDIVYVTVPRK